MPCILFLQFAVNHYRTHSKVNANVFLSWLPAIVSSLFLKGRMSFKKAKCCQQYFLLKSLLVLYGRHDRVQNNDWFKLTQQKNRESPPKKSSVTYSTHRITRYDLKLIIYFSDILYSHVKSFLNIREQKWSLNISFYRTQSYSKFWQKKRCNTCLTLSQLKITSKTQSWTFIAIIMLSKNTVTKNQMVDYFLS